jgi:thioredoxin-related protein
MKKILSFIVAIALTGSAFAQTSSMAIGTSFPEKKYNTLNVLTGKELTLEEAATNNGLLVIFTCNTCPFVIRNIDRTKEVLEYAKANNLGVMMVNSNEAQRNDADAMDKMTDFAKKQNYPNYVVDKGSDLANLFGASHTPEVYLFDGKHHKLVYKGAMDDSPADPKSAKVMYLKDAINNLLNNKPISPAETKSVGCSIKRAKA